MKLLQARFIFKLADLWIGAYWRWNFGGLEVWICLIPCCPLYLWFAVPMNDADYQRLRRWQ